MIRQSGSSLLVAVCLFAFPALQAGQLSDNALSLKATRTVSFTTDEGSWMSVTVSPDARTLVFELVGHLYSMPITGGEAKPITEGMSFNKQPRFSPDGKSIVFVSDRSGDDNLWVSNADGSNPFAITHEDNALFASPVWSLDGHSILVSKKKPHYYRGAYELWQYDLHGGSGLQIVKSKPSDQAPIAQWHNALGAAVAPDARSIYYAQRLGVWASERLPSWQIGRLDLRTGEEETITSAQGSAFRPEISPDGTKLIYGTRSDASTALRIRDLVTQEDRWLKSPVQHDDQEGSMSSRDLLPGYAFLPDGREIVLSYGGKFHRLNISTGEDKLIPFSATITRGLGPRLSFAQRVETGPVRARLIQGAAASPDGKQLAFSALRHLYLLDLTSPDAKPRRLTKDEVGEFQPAWSPDGQWIAYVTWQNQHGGLWKIKGDGTAQQRLTPLSARFSQPVWSPDSSKIVALKTSNYQATKQFDEWGRDMDMADLVWVPSAGGDAVRISAAVGFGGAHFAGDSERIYFTMKKSAGPLNADYMLDSMKLDGTDRRTSFTLKGKDFWGAEISPSVRIYLSPNQRTAIALFRNQIYLFDTPLAPGPTVIDISAPSLRVTRLTNLGADEVGWTRAGKTVTWTVGSSFFQLPVEEAGLYTADLSMTVASTTWPRQLKPLETKVTVEAPRYTPHGTVILRGARVISMRGDEVLEKADIVVVDNHIASVGAHAAERQFPGAKVIDVTGSTIVPGFIDTHAHWMQIKRNLLDTANWDFLATLAYGITAGRDPQTFTNDMFAYQDLADMGEIIGPRAYSTGPGIFFVNDFQSVDEAAEAISRYKDYYRTSLIKSYVVGDRRQRQFVVQASNRLQMMPTTEGFSDMALDLTHVIDGFGGAEHQFPIFPLYKDVIELVARSGIFYTPTEIIDYGSPGAENRYFASTDIHDDPKVRRFFPHDYIDSKTSRMLWYRKDEYTFPAQDASAAAIVQAGGKVCVGGHGELQGLSFHWQLWSLQEGKMSNMAALRAATLTGAEAIGFAQDLGSLEPGKLADLVVLKGNPLDDIHNTTAIRYVMKNGELFDGDTLDEVWPERKPLGSFWWSSDHP